MVALHYNHKDNVLLELINLDLTSPDHVVVPNDATSLLLRYALRFRHRFLSFGH